MMATRKSTASRKSTTRKSPTRKSTTMRKSGSRAKAAAPELSSARARSSAPAAAAAGRTAPEKAAAEPAAQARAGMPVQGVSLQAPAALGKKQLIEEVVARSGVKKKDVKPVVEAMLGVLGESVAAGRELNLQPFGKITIRKQNEKASARVSVARIRQSRGRDRNGGQKPRKDPLAEAAE